MLEQTTRIVTENLARTINRRTFLRRAGEVTFAGMAALAAGRGSSVLASGSPPPMVPQCAPPGPYCNLNGVNEPNGCHGGSCFQHLTGGQVQQCRVVYNWYQAGCWTTAVTGGYWVCCDCQCTGGSYCGCAQFSSSPQPRPDNPNGGGAKA
jgi:hypothetical protein